jgi:hypothetical protein
MTRNNTKGNKRPYAFMPLATMTRHNKKGQTRRGTKKTKKGGSPSNSTSTQDSGNNTSVAVLMDATNDASHDAPNLTRSTQRETNPDSHDHVLQTPSQPPSDARSSEATTQGGNDVELVAERSTPKGTTEYMLAILVALFLIDDAMSSCC